MNWLLMVIGAVMIVAACSADPEPTVSFQRLGGFISYFHDDAHDVSCWVYAGNGISCLPDSQVKR